MSISFKYQINLDKFEKYCFERQNMSKYPLYPMNCTQSFSTWQTNSRKYSAANRLLWKRTV